MSSIFDLCLSYIAYHRNPTYFVLREANREILPFFIFNIFPIPYFFGTTLLIISIIALTRAAQKIKEKGLNKESKQLIQLYYWLFGTMSLAHIFGGLTWFDPSKILVFFVYSLKTFTFILIFMIAYIALLVTYKTHKKHFFIFLEIFI